MANPQKQRSPREAGNGVCLGGHPQSITDTSTQAQRARLLAYLQHDSITTFQAIRDLNILRPGARVCELRNAGHNIVTRLIDLHDDHGRNHPRVALYSLLPSGASDGN